MNDIIIHQSDLAFTDAAGLAKSFLVLENIEAQIRAIKEVWQTRACELFDADPTLKEVEVGNSVVLYKAHDKRERFNTAKIYELFKFTVEQQAILERNPGFRKKELCKAVGMDMKDMEKEFVEVEWLDKVKVKPLDRKFIKG